MVQRQDVEFPVEGAAILRGWLFVPDGPRPHPGITMAHGFAGVKEHGLERFARLFAEAGFVVLVHDHRGFGASDGSPRFDVDPWVQIADWRRAISSSKTILPSIWASSAPAAPNGLASGVPAMPGDMPSCSALPTAGCVRSSPRCPRSAGMSRVCVAWHPSKCPRWRRVHRRRATPVPRRATRHPSGRQPDPATPAAYRSPDAIAFYNQPVPEGVWQNVMTVRSSRAARMYEPGTWISRVSPTPLLMIVGLNDTITVTDLALAAYERALQPKNSSPSPVATSTPISDRFDQAAGAARDWFIEHLSSPKPPTEGTVMTQLRYEVMVHDGLPRHREQRLPDGSPIVSSPVSSTLIYGDHDAVLVDPPFTRDQVQRVGEWVESPARR